MTDLFLVTKMNYPSVFRACELLSTDIGNQAGHKNYGINLVFEANMPNVEKALSELSTEDFDTLVIGEEGDKQHLLSKNITLVQADELLQHIYENL